ncbi:discoidin domain-containing protein [Paenibacillus lautus]|uniref:discoidin domain-containing protein n=1 Tax=Paenibacillus lautus TaxID=1401 RepID=UPI00203B1974|nr:discoidin domain-containing protein [Paenibacillus lautus]MCM3256970.1 discoidin domain-containing protein [Paenibacillus lautus]
MAYLSNENAIPLMTSNTAPSGVVSASSTFSANNEFHAFTNSTSDWRTANGNVAGWIRYDFPRKICISKYTVVPGSTITANPKLWTFEGSDDGMNWTILDSKGNQTSWTSSADYTISNRVSFSKYRLNISQNNGYSTHTNIRQLMMYEYVFDNKCLISDKDNNYYSLVMPDTSKNLIPPLASLAASTGIVASSNNASTRWEAFNGSKTDNGWLINLRNEPKTQWLSYRFPTPTVIDKYTISYVFTPTDAAPKSWTFEGSNDAINWTVLDTRTDEINWSQYSTREYVFHNKKAYMYYRIFVSDNNGGLYQIFISEIEMMQTNSTTIDLSTQAPNEDDFIKFGIDKATIIDLDRTLDTKSFLDKNGTNLGTGRVFKRNIDTTSVSIKKIVIN